MQKPIRPIRPIGPIRPFERLTGQVLWSKFPLNPRELRLNSSKGRLLYPKHISLRSPLLVLLVFVFVSNAKAQCTQKLSDLPAAPELFGFHMGMNKEEVKALVPQTRFKKDDDFGVSKTTINPQFDDTIDKTKFPAVRSVSLDFLDERLTSLWIGFDETFKVQALDEFAAAISQSFRLPNAWQPWRFRAKQMRCADFQISVQVVAGGPSVRVVNVAAEDTIAARRQAKEEMNSAMEVAGANNDAESAQVVGDRKTKNYYAGDCQAGNEVAAADRVVFKSVEDAEKAGFKLAKRCN
jgi:hypothetical protein